MQMSKSICPYLGILDADQRPRGPIDYPSFENQCFATATGELLMLTEQATLCLAGSYRQCPHFQAAQQQLTDEEPVDAPPGAYPGTPGAEFAPFDTPFPEGGIFVQPVPSLSPDEADTPYRRRWAWAGAGVLFVMVFLCGAGFALYTGWQMVSANYLAQRTAQNNAQIDTVNPVTLTEQSTTQPLYVVMTATSAPAPVNPPAANEGETVNGPANNQTGVTQPPAAQNFPPAVTPTPTSIVINPLGQITLPALNEPAPITDNLAQISTQVVTESTPNNLILPTPDIDLNVEIPTRRPTPVFDVPTSTPITESPTATPTATPPLGTPVVVFGPLQYGLASGQCTLVRWHVENVQAVYYENQGVNGDGEREVCINDENEIVRLSVVLPSGVTQLYTTTIEYLPPTPTVTPTPSFTPEGQHEPTPTWTPDTPAATVTPVINYGVSLSSFGDSQRICGAGSTCEFDLLVGNTGNSADTLLLSLVQSGPWATLLCADNGDCSPGSLSVGVVEPGRTKLVKLRVSIASDATPQSAGYSLQALSSGAGGGVTSGVVNVQVQVQ
jgi:hypothetical protein